MESRTVYRYITSGLGEHSWDEGTVTTEPTTDSAGIRTYTCAVCGDTKEETIDKLAAITINIQPEDYTGQQGVRLPLR